MPNRQRLTLIARDPAKHELAWNDAATATRRVVFLDPAPRVGLVLTAALAEPTLDTERVIVDRTATAETFLDLLSMLPVEFIGDVLWIEERGGGFLSAAGRGGDRRLYALTAGDVGFYLTTHDLVAGTASDPLRRAA